MTGGALRLEDGRVKSTPTSRQEPPMSEKPISPLRRRMLEDMDVRRLGEKTKSNYIYHVSNFTTFLGRSPDTATAEEVRRFQVQLTEMGVGPSSVNQAATALRFFFGTTVDRPEL